MKKNLSYQKIFTILQLTDFLYFVFFHYLLHKNVQVIIIVIQTQQIQRHRIRNYFSFSFSSIFLLNVVDLVNSLSFNLTMGGHLLQLPKLIRLNGLVISDPGRNYH